MTLSVTPNNNPHQIGKATEETANKPQIKTDPGLCADLHDIKNSQQALTGKTISPQMAEKTVNLVSYDGTGKILGFKTKLTPGELVSLQKSVIPALKDSPVRFTENKILTPAECLINLVCLIKKSELPAQDKQKTVEQAKAIYLAGEVKESLPGFYKALLRQHAENHQQMPGKAGELINALEKQVYYTKRHDNYFGRLFETRLAEQIVNAPSPEMQHVTQVVMDQLIADFEKHSYFQQRKICAALRNGIKNDWATWYVSIPEVKKFINHNTPQNFLAMLNTSNALRPVLAMHLTVKYIVAPTGLNYMRGETLMSYANIIQPQRYWNDYYTSTHKYSNRTGIQLTYQMKEQAASQKVKGVRPIDQTRQNMSNVADHDKSAFGHEKPVGVGMSGSANLLNFFFRRLKKNHTDFSLEHARLLAACSLVHSGGHSINESWTVFNNLNFTPVPYNKLVPDDEYMAAALDNAWEKMTAEAALLYA